MKNPVSRPAPRHWPQCLSQYPQPGDFCFRSNLLDAKRYVGAEICIEGIPGISGSTFGEPLCPILTEFTVRQAFAIGTTYSQHIRAFSIVCYYEAGSSLPAVKTCWIEGVQALDAEVLEPVSCHFKTIRIHQSCLGFRTLVHVIRSCEELQEFEYSFGSFQTEDMQPIVPCQDFLDALCRHAETLRVLDLDLGAQRTDVDNRYDGQTVDEAAAGLADFSVMTHLSLGMDFLLCFARGVTGEDDDGHFSLIELLPPQLEYLTIYWYRPGKNERWDGLLEELKEKIVDGDDTGYTLRGVDEYLRHPTNTETELEPEADEISEGNENEKNMGSDSDATDISRLIAPA